MPVLVGGFVSCDNDTSGYKWDGMTLTDGNAVIGSVVTSHSRGLDPNIDIEPVGTGLYRISVGYIAEVESDSAF